MILEIIDAGFTKVELGYDLNIDLVPGVKDMVNKGAISVTSIHNYCPVPIIAPMGHPELFLLTSTDKRYRQAAIRYTTDSINFASEIGAQTVVIHAGRVEMRHITPKLISLFEEGKQHQPKYEKLKVKLMMKREKKVGKYLVNLRTALEDLLPVLEKKNVCLGIENLPSWEAIPSESEMLEMLKSFDSKHIRYWHDIGHGQVRQNLGFIGHLHWLRKLGPWLQGMHVHDVAAPAFDHIMPPLGSIDFQIFKEFINTDRAMVLEPAPGTPLPDIITGRQLLIDIWGNKKQ
ncbi:MAG: sugar phosphate isomerase/epimerase [Kiritimatiellae bacterium]|nr:sugar phosphate isomerase/epimerase [Kiritimatiellia bacterium]